ncbi:sugar nucleotide-binding protein [Candidatus Pacearchaeota archaeon]|nr:sugar nucleotide-binding protein [Candidatus Pacearchaeota archaeon]
MNILIFGSNGMLGRYMKTYLSSKYDVSTVDRKQLDLSLVRKKEELYSFLHTYPILFGIDVVINCAGVIKPRVSDAGSAQTISVNSVFPHLLSSICEENNIKLCHISSDCVFSGKSREPYYEYQLDTATDLYGKSKLLGEPSNCSVIRTSIIGEEIGQSRSLIEWAKTQKGKQIKGFIDHLWNGISCLQLSELISLIIEDKNYWKGIRHVFSPNSVSKYELLNMINDVYDLQIKIEKTESGDYCHRVLKTQYELWGKYLKDHIPEIKEQIIKMKNFKLQ